MSDCLDIGSRVLFKGRPGTIVNASPEMSGPPGWWVIVMDDGSRECPLEGHPELEHWTPAAPSARLYALRDRQLRTEFLRTVLDDVRDGYLEPEQGARLIDLVSA